MAKDYGQFERGGEARRLLRDRLQREEMGDEAYEKMKSYADDRAFKIFGVVSMALFAVVVLVITSLGF